MLKYCKIINEETGLVQVGAGCPDEYYIEIGMKKRNVKQSDVDGEWYLYDKCPVKPEPTPKDREENFKSRFFEVQGYGWYRKRPKGYQSAIESLNTAFNRFEIMQKMGVEEFPANVFIFYQEPDFTNPEECTEEWLVAHQTKNKAMTVQEFGSFYATFTDAWNTEEHE